MERSGSLLSRIFRYVLGLSTLLFLVHLAEECVGGVGRHVQYALDKDEPGSQQS